MDVNFIMPHFDILSDINPITIYKDIEKAARTCYKSEDKISSDTASAEKIISNLIKRNHTAMLEFANITVRIVCSRGLTHELVRHRHCSFAQESTRYVSYKGAAELIVQPWIVKDLLDIDSVTEITNHDYEDACDIINRVVLTESIYYNDLIKELKNNGKEHIIHWVVSLFQSVNNYNEMLLYKDIPQNARDLLPINIKTEIVLNANIREWLHIFSLRDAPPAHPEIRYIMHNIHNHFKDVLPIIFR